MDAIKNPFVPGAGSNPPILAGRRDILEHSQIVLERVRLGKGAKSFFVVGLRGVGKTVLLNQIFEQSIESGFLTIQIEAHENKPLPALLIPKFRQSLLQLDRGKKANELARRGLRVLAAFTNAIGVKIGDVEFSFSIDPEIGAADSGDLETDLPDLFEVVAGAAKARESAIVLIVDELQYLSEVEMSALIMAMHRVSQRNLPLVLVGGGLPQLVGLAGRSKSYAERLFDYPELGPLDREDADEAIVVPIRGEGADITPEAVDAIYQVTRGYPYFIQTWGYHSWNASNGPTINADDIATANVRAIQTLDESFFRVRFDRLSQGEKTYLFAMAKLGPGPHRSGDIAERLGKKVQAVAFMRSALIKKGMIYSPSHGDTAFTVPMFDEYLRRVNN